MRLVLLCGLACALQVHGVSLTKSSKSRIRQTPAPKAPVSPATALLQTVQSCGEKAGQAPSGACDQTTIVTLIDQTLIPTLQTQHQDVKDTLNTNFGVFATCGTNLGTCESDRDALQATSNQCLTHQASADALMNTAATDNNTPVCTTFEFSTSTLTVAIAQATSDLTAKHTAFATAQAAAANQANTCVSNLAAYTQKAADCISDNNQCECTAQSTWAANVASAQILETGVKTEYKTYLLIKCIVAAAGDQAAKTACSNADYSTQAAVMDITYPTEPTGLCAGAGPAGPAGGGGPWTDSAPGTTLASGGQQWVQGAGCSWCGVKANTPMCDSPTNIGPFQWDVTIDAGTYHQVGIAQTDWNMQGTVNSNPTDKFAFLYSHSSGWNRHRGAATPRDSSSQMWAGVWDRVEKGSVLTVTLDCNAHTFSVATEQQALATMIYPSTWTTVVAAAGGQSSDNTFSISAATTTPAAATTRAPQPVTTFGTGEIAGYPYHTIAGIHDGRYGNSQSDRALSSSWISDGATLNGNIFAGYTFGTPTTVCGVSMARDRTGAYSDRTGNVRIELTTAANVDANTPNSEWVDAGSYMNTAGLSTYQVSTSSTTQWTAIRAVVSSGGICIDELETTPC